MKSSLKGLKQTFGRGSLIGDFGSILAGGGAIAGLVALGRSFAMMQDNIVKTRAEIGSVGNETDVMMIGFMRGLPIVGGMFSEIADEANKAKQAIADNLKLIRAIAELERQNVGGGTGLNKKLFDIETLAQQRLTALTDMRTAAELQGDTGAMSRIGKLIDESRKRSDQDRRVAEWDYLDPDVAYGEGKVKDLLKAMPGMDINETLEAIEAIRGLDGAYASSIQFIERRARVLENERMQQANLNQEVRESNELALFMGKQEESKRDDAKSITEGNKTPLEQAMDSIEQAWGLKNTGDLPESEFIKFVQRTAKGLDSGSGRAGPVGAMGAGSSGAQSVIGNVNNQTQNVAKAMESQLKKLIETAENTGASKEFLRLLYKAFNDKIGVAD
jgi:hypothetical protein